MSLNGKLIKLRGAVTGENGLGYIIGVRQEERQSNKCV